LLSASLAATVKRTTDGGATWDTTESKPHGISTLFMSYMPGTAGSYVITAGTTHGPFTGSAYTRDNGATWAIVDHASHGKAAFVSASVGWSWGGADTIYRWTDPTVPVRDESSHWPDHIELSQNYPNPFNPSTTIRYMLPEKSHATLTVSSTLGQQVVTLVEGEMEAGYHEVKFDASHLASGVYLYRLQAAGFVQARKLILMK